METTEQSTRACKKADHLLYGTFGKTKSQLQEAQAKIWKDGHHMEKNIAYVDETHPIGFLSPLFLWHRDPAMTSNGPELIFGIILLCIVKYVEGQTHFTVPADVAKIHTLLGGFLAFLLAMRANAANHAYIDGRGHLGGMMNGLRQICLNVYTLNLDPNDEDEIGQVVEAERIRRYCNILYAFIRQAMRESRHGFNPKYMKKFRPETKLQAAMKCAYEDAESDHPGVDHAHVLNQYYLEDPTMPLISFMLKENLDVQEASECELFDDVPASFRPAVCAMHLQALLRKFITAHGLNGTNSALHLQMAIYEDQITEVLNAFKSCLKIIDTPVPFVYTHMLNTLIFVFVYATPFIYLSSFAHGAGWAALILLVLSYYGINKVSVMLQDPFGWDFDVDHDLEKYGIKVHEETYWMARKRDRMDHTDAIVHRYYSAPSSKPEAGEAKITGATHSSIV